MVRAHTDQISLLLGWRLLLDFNMALLDALRLSWDLDIELNPVSVFLLLKFLLKLFVDNRVTRVTIDRLVDPRRHHRRGLLLHPYKV